VQLCPALSHRKTPLVLFDLLFGTFFSFGSLFGIFLYDVGTKTHVISANNSPPDTASPIISPVLSSVSPSVAF
jgi:hypothetical protein